MVKVHHMPTFLYPPTKFGVLYTPFQVPYIPADHKELIETISKRHEVLIFALPVKRITPSKTSPLDFKTRKEMIEFSYGWVRPYHIVPVVDRKYPADQVAALHAACSAPFSSFGKATLYTTQDFGPVYQQFASRSWPVLHTVADLDCNLLTAELETRMGVQVSPQLPEPEDDMEYFRRGIIYGLNGQFPISWGTVDIAVKRVIDGKKFYLLGKKPGEKNWRFPGGFKDRGDNCYEVSVIREASEEVLSDTVTVASGLFSDPVYIGSRNVCDWRYRGEIDGITTSFYEIGFTGKDEQIKAGDDLAEAKWFAMSEMKRDDMEGEHIFLYDLLMKHNQKG